MSSVNEKERSIAPYNQDGRRGFLPGNPGRPKGVLNKFSLSTLRAIQDQRDLALAALREKLQTGDMGAIAYVLDRCGPKTRTLELPDLSTEALQEVASEGAATTQELKEIAAVLEKLKKIEEVDTLRDRIVQLEKLLENRVN